MIARAVLWHGQNSAIVESNNDLWAKRPLQMRATAAGHVPQVVDTAIPKPIASTWEIFREFLIIGATSFGGVVPYLRGSLVTKRRWIDDKEFVEMLSISQSLPGLECDQYGSSGGREIAWTHGLHGRNSGNLFARRSTYVRRRDLLSPITLGQHQRLDCCNQIFAKHSPWEY